METRHPVEGSFGNAFQSIYHHCGIMAAWSHKTLKKIIFAFFFEKRPITGKFSKILFWKDSSPYRLTCCVQISWNLADGKSVKSCVAYLTKKTKFRLALQLSLLRGSRPRSVRASPQECTQSDRDFIQIGSLSAELFPNAWTPSNGALKWIQYSAKT